MFFQNQTPILICAVLILPQLNPVDMKTISSSEILLATANLFMIKEGKVLWKYVKSWLSVRGKETRWDRQPERQSLAPKPVNTMRAGERGVSDCAQRHSNGVV